MKIAISGAYRSGKTYLATSLAAHSGLPSYAFADVMKDELATEYPHLYDEIFTAGDKTAHIRQLLRAKGLQLNNNQCFTTYKIASQIQLDGFGIISDLRFTEELDYCLANKFVIIYIGELAVDQYSLKDIYHYADLRLPRRPNVNLTSLLRFLNNLYNIKLQNV